MDRKKMVDQKTLDEIIRRIVEVAHPEKIILFGSAARGEMGPNSDVDLLLIKSGTDALDLMGQIYRNLHGVGTAVDAIVVTPEDVERFKDSHALVIKPALREGQHADPVELFVATAASMMFGLPEEPNEANYGTVSVKTERLAYELYPHFGRSWAACEIEQIESTTLHMGDIRACHEVLDDLLHSYSFKAFMPSKEEEDEIISSTRGRTAVVRGNAYPPQTERRIREVQGRFDDWYAKQVGIAPTRAVEALRAILKDAENAFNDAARLAAATDVAWNALLSLIGLTSEERQKMHEPIEVRNRPLYVLPDSRVLLVHVSNTFDVLWEAFDAAARQDHNFYDTRQQKHAANWLEERVVGYLRRLFPGGDIYRTLDYPDPVHMRGATAELDVAVVWGPFLLLIEAKAKQFRLAGQLGDVGRLRTDLKRNVEEAFDQAIRARKYIESAERPVFKERRTNRELVLQKARLRRV